MDLDEEKGLQTLTECLARSGATQPEFARMMGVEASTLWRWLSGKRPVTGVAIRAALFCAAMSGIPLRMPNPSQYLSVTAKASKNPHVR